MRASDIMEVRTNAIMTGRMGPDWSLESDVRQGFTDGSCWSLWDGGELVGMAGVAVFPPVPQIGAIWFLGTDAADRKWRSMTRACKGIKPMLEQGFEYVGNVVPESMTRRIAWLEYLGFDIENDKANVADGYVAFWSHPQTAPKTVQRPR